MTSSSRSPERRPCNALTGIGSPRPSARNSHISVSRRSLSALLATTSTGTFSRRNHCASWSSSSVRPDAASTTNTTRSAARTAASTWRLTLASSTLPPGSQPPVSTSRNGTPSHSASSSLRSRVTPGWSSTMAACLPITRLNSVLLPTFGRPTITTVGSATSDSVGVSVSVVMVMQPPARGGARCHRWEGSRRVVAGRPASSRRGTARPRGRRPGAGSGGRAARRRGRGPDLLRPSGR